MSTLARIVETDRNVVVEMGNQRSNGDELRVRLQKSAGSAKPSSSAVMTDYALLSLLLFGQPREKNTYEYPNSILLTLNPAYIFPEPELVYCSLAKPDDMGPLSGLCGQQKVADSACGNRRVFSVAAAVYGVWRDEYIHQPQTYSMSHSIQHSTTLHFIVVAMQWPATANA